MNLFRDDTRLSTGAAAPAILAGRQTLAERVMGLTCLLIGLASAGVLVGGWGANNAFSSGGHYLLYVIAEVALLLGTLFLADVPILGILLFSGFGLATGLVIAPLIHILALRGQGVIVFQALAATAAVTGGLTLYARTTTRDFSRIGGYLFAALLGLVVVSVIGIFVHSTLLQIAISGGACVLFSLYLVYDVQRIAATRDTRGNAIRLALSIYIDILNLFVNLLSLLAILQGDERR